jgi:hypothetical protein
MTVRVFSWQTKGVADGNLLYLRNLWLNPFQFLVKSRRPSNRNGSSLTYPLLESSCATPHEGQVKYQGSDRQTKSRRRKKLWICVCGVWTTHMGSTVPAWIDP